jgi:hypothetical protein
MAVNLVKTARNARWQLVDPRWTAGLLGGDGPPFGVLTARFSRNGGFVQRLSDYSDLTAFARPDPGKFTASYKLQSLTGAFSATITDEGHLKLKFTGSRKLECEARLRGLNDDAKLAILTCITNGVVISSPGHSAIIADDKVYTFENLTGGALSENSGWSILKTTDYLSLPGNVKRPIVIQELDMQKVNAGKALAYIQGSIANDEDYLGSGVCSTQAASAIDAGITGGFDPWGVDTPHSVFALANERKIVSRSYYIWDSSKSPADKVAGLVEKLANDYAGVPMAKGFDVRSWREP